ncbi:MAG: FAD-dependent oxidoreductase, partial [Candidatus Riflebacteria bacterium]|nr:FAD-dependent oxidoreductase [Candidatus Riflebacteria bacterium]
LLATEEEEISKFVATEFEKNNITVLTNTAIIDAGTNKSLKILNIENVITKEKTTIEADAIFIASGVASNSNSLKLENTDVEIDSRGWIKTNQYLETTQKNVYAIGDINGKYQFRHKANYEAQILMNNLFSNDKKRAACYNAVPWAIFSWPQIAHVGLTESQAKKEGLNYWIGRNYFSQIAGGIAMGINKNSTDNGFIKIIVGEDKTILGVHVVGPHAAILLQPFVYLMNVKHKCEKQNLKKCNNTICPQLGNYLPINDSMIIHPSLNELTAWVLENINWK